MPAGVPTSTPSTAALPTTFPLPKPFAWWRVSPSLGSAGLRHLSGMTYASRVIATPGGLEAATWTSVKRAQIGVWRKPEDGQWHEIGRTTYPGNNWLRHCVPIVTGRLLSGARHATFIVHGCFAGDGMVNAVAISDGPRGWGVLAESGHRLAARPPNDDSKAAGAAVLFNIAFDHGNLLTIEGNAFFGNAGQAGFPRLILWKRDGAGFTAIGDSGFTAVTTDAPDGNAPHLTGNTCPSVGTFRASFGLRLRGSQPRGFHPNPDLELWVFPSATTYPGRPLCDQSVHYNLPLTVTAAYQRAKPSWSRRGPVTNRRWITAPVWFLLNPDRDHPEPFFNVGPSEAYVVPRALGVNEMRSRLGTPYLLRRGIPHGHPANGTVTFRNGRVVSLAVF